MAIRLDHFVVCGEINNTVSYATHGWIGLKGREQPVMLQLTGNCAPDLRGKRFRFEARVPPGADPVACAKEADELPQLTWQQVGPTGDMTAAHRIRFTECPPGELTRRARLGELPPTEWKRCLYLEWFSQNGRIVLELADPIIEFLDEQCDGDASEPDVWLEGETELDYSANVEPDDAGEEPVSPNDDDTMFLTPPFSQETSEDEESEEDPYGLFPDGLNRHFETEARQTDLEISDDESGASESLQDLELMDELIERGEGELISNIFEDPMKLPRPEQLDDEAAEKQLKSLLTQLALYGIALDVCSHFTPRDAYRLLLEEICTEERVYPELRHTQWVQHFMTSEFCEECDAEMQRDFDDSQQRKRRPEDLGRGEDPL